MGGSSPGEGLWGSCRSCGRFRELFSAPSSHCLEGAAGPVPQVFPRSCQEGSLSCRREVRSLPWGLDQPHALEGGRPGPHKHPEKEGLWPTPTSQLSELRPAEVTQRQRARSAAGAAAPLPGEHTL